MFKNTPNQRHQINANQNIKNHLNINIIRGRPVSVNRSK